MLEDGRDIIEISDSSDDELVQLDDCKREADIYHPIELDSESEWSNVLAGELLDFVAAPTGHDELSLPLNPLSQQECLDGILQIFPDISHDHVVQLYSDHLAAGDAVFDVYEILVRRILDKGVYPKEKDKQELKRKRAFSNSDDEEAAQLQKKGLQILSPAHQVLARQILTDEFPRVPVKYIDQLVKRGGSLFPCYLELEKTERNDHAGDLRYARLVTPRKRSNFTQRIQDFLEPVLGNNDLFEELQIARRACAKSADQRRAAAVKANAEIMNEQEARENGSILDCGCCFTEYPVNRMAHCNGQTPHFFCLSCARRNVEVDIGQSRCRPKCMDVSDCNAGFDRVQLLTFLETKTLYTLERMQQLEDIRLANLDDLEECPFCDFKAIYPSVDEDREFRCCNVECAKVSCRLCKHETHVPQSCQEFAKENKLTVRHVMEEAMTQALVRLCNRCQVPYLKDFGCNKMVCSKCGSKQCYVCSETITDYNHFSNAPHGGRPDRCPLFDDTELRHTEEVKKAEAAAVAKLRQEHPNISEDDLKIKVSEEDERAEQRRPLRDEGLGFPGQLPGHIPHQMHQLAQRMDVFENQYQHMLERRQERVQRLQAHLARVRERGAPQPVQPPIIPNQPYPLGHRMHWPFPIAPGYWQQQMHDAHFPHVNLPIPHQQMAQEAYGYPLQVADPLGNHVRDMQQAARERLMVLRQAHAMPGLPQPAPLDQLLQRPLMPLPQIPNQHGQRNVPAVLEHDAANIRNWNGYAPHQPHQQVPAHAPAPAHQPAQPHAQDERHDGRNRLALAERMHQDYLNQQARELNRLNQL